MSKKIEVLAAYTMQAVLDHKCIVVYDYFDNIKEAKAKAKYCLTDDFQRIGEMSQPCKYAQVVVNGECIADYFRKGYNGEESQQ